MALGDIIARLAVSLQMETAAFEKGATLAEKRMAQSQRRFESIGKSMSGIGQRMSLGVTAPLTALAVSSYQAAQESADALGQVNAALASMGDASGRTTEQLQALAETQMGQSLYDDDEILRKVTANLLTFGNVSGTAFDQAQQAAIDLSARLGTDLQSSAVMVGKALNDPIKGITALSRVGVSFTEQQKEQITAMAEAGNVAGAQALILAELERQYGGAAAAARAADPTAESKQAWADFQETIGELVVKVLPPLTSFLTKVLEGFNNLSPGMQKAVVIGGAVVAALGPVLTLFGGLVTVGAPLLAFLTTLGPVLSIVAKALLLIALNPAVLALAAVIGGIYLAWKNWDKINAIVERLVSKVEGLIGGRLASVLRAVLNPIEAVRKGFYHLYDAVVGNSYVPDMVDGIAAEMARLDAVMVQPVARATSAAEQAFRDMADRTRGILARLFPEVQRMLDYQQDLADLRATGNASADRTTEAERRLREELGGVDRNAKTEPDFSRFPGAGIDTSGVQAGLEAIVAATAKVKDGWADLKKMGGEAFAELGYQLSGVIKGAQSLGDALKNVLGMLADMAMSMAWKALGTSLKIPGFAGGTNFAPGGLALVGERGPELVNLPRGSQVIPNGQTRDMLSGSSGGNAFTWNVFAQDANSFRKSERQMQNEARRRLG